MRSFLKKVLWDKAEFGRIAKERAAEERQELLNLDLDQLASKQQSEFGRPELPKLRPGQQRAALRKTRDDTSVRRQIESKVGSKLRVAASALRKDRGGWFCEVCQCQLKDSHSYLDHINGRKHHRRLGMSMRVEQSALSEVMAVMHTHSGTAKLKEARKRKRKLAEMLNGTAAADAQSAKMGVDVGATDQCEFDDKVEASRKRMESAEEKERERKRRKRQRKKETQANGSKKAESSDGATVTGERIVSATDKGDEAGDYVDEEIDPEMVALGFNFSFGGSKKT